MSMGAWTDWQKLVNEDGDEAVTTLREQDQIIARLTAEVLQLKERCAALESREVCTVAHENVETCGYCQLDELLAERALLVTRAENAEAALVEANETITGIPTLCRRYEARLAEAERDAARYRFLRDQDGMGNIFMHTPTCDLDATIDREIAADSASAVQPERCCVDYPRCDCNSPPEPDNLPCGHPASLLLRSAETGEPLYCELCDDKSGRRDAEQREVDLQARLAKLQGGEACCVTHGEGACQLTCVKCNDELRSRLAEANLNLAAVPTMCRRYEARLAEADALLRDVAAVVYESTGVYGFHMNGDLETWDYWPVFARIDAHLAREEKP
jgi:uncharacterized protein YciW